MKGEKTRIVNVPMMCVQWLELCHCETTTRVLHLDSGIMVCVSQTFCDSVIIILSAAVSIHVCLHPILIHNNMTNVFANYHLKL